MHTRWYSCKFRFCDCSLKTFGLLYGWMGVIWRTIVTVTLSLILSRTTYYDPTIYDIALITALAYIQLSLITNMFYIIGIQKEKPYFMLPFVVIGGMELFAGVAIGVMGSILLFRLRLTNTMATFITIFISVTVIYLYFWIKSIQLFRELEVEINRKREEEERIASIRQSVAY